MGPAAGFKMGWPILTQVSAFYNGLPGSFETARTKFTYTKLSWPVLKYVSPFINRQLVLKGAKF